MKRHVIVILMGAILLCGCGDARLKTVPVTGKVVFPDGSPVRTGTIELESRDHPVTATGQIRNDGTFVVGTYETSDGAVPGLHQVIVLQKIISDGTINHTMDHGRKVDPRHATYGTSGLTVMINPTQGNNLIIEVQAASGK